MPRYCYQTSSLITSPKVLLCPMMWHIERGHGNSWNKERSGLGCSCPGSRDHLFLPWGLQNSYQLQRAVEFNYPGLYEGPRPHLNQSQPPVFCFHHCCCLVSKSCPTLCDSMECSSPGSSVHVISQTRMLLWVAISFSKGSSWSRDRTQVSCFGRQILYHWAPGPWISLC